MFVRCRRYRFLETLNVFTDHKSYLITDWSITGVSISIYTPGKLEFLRYQTIDTTMKKWRSRQIDDAGSAVFI